MSNCVVGSGACVRIPDGDMLVDVWWVACMYGDTAASNFDTSY